MIRVENLTARRGDFTLGPIDLACGGSSYLTLLGPSGAGKTLFLEACMGLLRPAGGRVWLEGREVTAVAPERRQISYLPQDLALFPHLGVRENILFGARRRRLDQRRVESRLGELADLLDLGELLDREDIFNLSGGEKQRVALARALLPEPRLLFLDEPFSALDATVKRHLQVKLRQVNRELGVTILHVTHDQEEAFMLGERIAVMIRGRLRQVGSRDDIYYRPATLEVARFLHNQNIFTLTVEEVLPDGSLRLGDHRLRLLAPGYAGAAPGDRLAAGIRSEEVVIIRPGRPIGSELRDNLFPATVSDILVFGGTHTICATLNGSGVAIDVQLPNCAMRDLGYGVGDTLQLCLRKRSLWTIPLTEARRAKEVRNDPLR